MPDAGFALRPIREVDRDLVLDFGQRTWGEHGAEEIQSKWWLTSDHADATAAVDEASGRIAGMVVAVPGLWPLPDGTLARTVSICGWFVAPDFAGRGLGKLLVRSFDDRAPCQNALSISDAAISNFRKLGWSGPYSTRLLLLPFPGWRRSPEPNDGLALRSYDVRGADLPAELAEALDRIEALRPTDQIRRARTAADWRSHLGVRPSRVQHFHVVSRDGEPIGAFVIRATDGEAGSLYRRTRLHYVTDVVLNTRDGESLRFLAESMGPAAPGSAGALLLCTSSEPIANAAQASAWLSERSAGIGPRLAAKAPRYMLGGGLAAVSGADVVMTFTDSDVDLNI